MNQIQATKRINDYALETGDLSWHDQYKDSAYVNVGGLPPNLTEGDVITIFSQYGEIVDINMPRDPQTGKPRGFAWLMYADQRSTVLAVDNLNGATVLNRTLRVDHVLNYKQLERDQETGKMKEREERSLAAHPDKFRPTSDASDAESDSSHPSIDLDDPMREYLIEQKRAAKKRRIESGGAAGESKEEKRRRKEERRRKREERERRRERKAIDGGAAARDRPRGGEDARRRERGDSRDPAAGRSRRDDHDRDRDRERDSGARRRDDERGSASSRRRVEDKDVRDRRPRDEGRSDRGEPDRDGRRDDEYRRRDERDERDERDRRGGGSGPGSGMSAFADLERLVRGR